MELRVPETRQGIIRLSLAVHPSQDAVRAADLLCFPSMASLSSGRASLTARPSVVTCPDRSALSSAAFLVVEI